MRKVSINAVIGDNQRLGRAGEEIDAHAAEELALRLGNIRIAGSDQHVHGRNTLRAERHRANRLDAAKAVDLIRTGHVLGRDDRGRRLPRKGGAQVTTRGTPATFAVITDICAEASNGYLPPGT